MVFLMMMSVWSAHICPLIFRYVTVTIIHEFTLLLIVSDVWYHDIAVYGLRKIDVGNPVNLVLCHLFFMQIYQKQIHFSMT